MKIKDIAKTLKIKTREKDVAAGILKYLQMLENNRDAYIFRNNSYRGKILRKDGSTGYLRNNKKGTPDIICLYKGKYLGIETKSSIGKQSAEQIEAQKRIERAGGYYWIIRDIDILIKKLKDLDSGK